METSDGGAKYLFVQQGLADGLGGAWDRCDRLGFVGVGHGDKS